MKPYRCSFCGKSQHEVPQIVAGPDVCICNHCVDLCVQILTGVDAGQIEYDSWLKVLSENRNPLTAEHEGAEGV